MAKRILLCMAFILSMLVAEGATRRAVIADSLSRQPLPSASIFDRHGNALGTTNGKGRIPYVSSSSYPLTIRYLGFQEKTIAEESADTIFLQEIVQDLPEVLVESKQHKVLHILAYLREYSTLSSYTDTIFLFREKMADFMLVPDSKIKLKGWPTPRLLASKSYYRFTDAYGLDSVSDNCNHHFSWTDWIGIVTPPRVPDKLRGSHLASDTIRGKYSPTEIWTRNDDTFRIDVNVLADDNSRKWVPGLATFFSADLDFENFRLRFNYGNVDGDTISATDLTGYSFNIESRGRGHDMFLFNRANEPFYVNTYAEVYIIDKEYITLKEAKKWTRLQPGSEDIEILEPPEAPELQPNILGLIARVDSVDSYGIRLAVEPDNKMVNKNFGKKNRNFQIGYRALTLLKDMTGITLYKSRKKFNNNWKKFKHDWKESEKKRLQKAKSTESDTSTPKEKH